MRYLIIGLGIYGSNLAVDLTKMGHEVIGADRSPQLVESIKDYISTAYIIDATDRAALSALPLSNVDLVIVSIGENFGASVRTVALLKELGVRHIYARAIDKLHESILEGFHIDRIITPEQRAAADLTRELSLGADVMSMRIDETHFVFKFQLPEAFAGLEYSKIPAFSTHGMKLVAVARVTETPNMLGMKRLKATTIAADLLPHTEAMAGDIMTVFGTDAQFKSLCSSL